MSRFRPPRLCLLLWLRLAATLLALPWSGAAQADGLHSLVPHDGQMRPYFSGTNCFITGRTSLTPGTGYITRAELSINGTVVIAFAFITGLLDNGIHASLLRGSSRAYRFCP